MKIVYVASPYTSKTEWQLYTHIHRAHVTCRKIWEMKGLCAISPCSNSAHMGGDEIPLEKWYEGDLEIVRRCDAIFLNEGWENSSGCIKEKEFAEAHNIPVFTDLEKLRVWANLRELEDE